MTLIFGRKKKERQADLEANDEESSETVETELADDDASAVDTDESPAEAEDADEDLDEDPDEADAPELDEWQLLDQSRDWREDGPFDISEVDLDADDIQRLDLGGLILTPFDGMQVQLQMNKENKAQAILVAHEKSGLELALFAAPAQSDKLADARAEMAVATEQAKGKFSLAEGPFGTEVRRVVPVETPDGKKGHHVSRTWLVEGPKWLLRGVLMGEAALVEGTEGPAELLFEFFSNIVVRRGTDPRVPGELIALDVPEEILAQAKQ